MSLISKFRSSAALKKTLFVLIMVFSFAYIFCVPSFGERDSFLRYTIYIAMALLGTVSILYCFLYDTLKVNRVALLIPAFALFALIGTAIYSKEFRPWFSLVLLAISFFVFVYAFKALKSKILIMIIISSAFFLFSLYFIYIYRSEISNFKSYISDSFRLGTYFDNQNGVAAYAIVGFSASLYLTIFWKRKIKWLFIIPTLSIFLVGITTGSKTFLLMSFIFLLIFLFFRFKKRKLLFLSIFIVVVAIGVVVLFLPFMETIRNRLFKAIGTIFGLGVKTDTSTIERVVWTDYAFYFGFKRMIFGFGFNGFASISGVSTYSHSNYAELFCDFGIIGFSLFYLPLAILVFAKKKKANNKIVISFVLYYVLVSFSNVLYYRKIYYLVLAFLFFLTFINIESQETRNLPVNVSKIVFTCDGMESGGAEKVIAVLSNEFAKKGIEVVIIGVSTHSQKSFYPLDNHVKYLTIHNGKAKRIGTFRRIVMLRKMIKEIKPDSIISFLPHVNVYTYFAIRDLNIPFFVSERNDPYSNPNGRFLRLLKRYVFYRADGCVFQTADARDFYIKPTRKKGIIIKNPICVDTEPYEGKREKTIISVGRLEKQKNIPRLIKAFEIFHKKHNDYKLKIYGAGSEEEFVKQLINDSKSKSSIVLMGNSTTWHRDEIKAGVFVLASDYEGIPNSLGEAISLGIPSVSTDCPIGGPKELISEGKNGFLSKTFDPSDLAVAIENASKLTIQKVLVNEFRASYSATSISNQWIDYISKRIKVFNDENSLDW